MKTKTLLLAASLLVPSLTLHAENASSAPAISQERMQQVYEEVKTPYKYGIVLRGEADQLVDSPSIFRKDGQWYMVYIASTKNVGYETCLARSSDLLNWEKLGKILSFPAEGWDRWQRAGYLALVDPAWGGSNELETYDGKYWMSYLGGPLIGEMQERSIESAIEAKSPGAYQAVSKSDSYFFGTYRALDPAKLAALPEAESQEISTIAKTARQGSLAKVIVFPAFMLVCYLGLILWFRSRGGYKAVNLSANH